MTLVRAPYMAWAKARRPARFDLAGSNLLPCSLDELPGAREALALDGANADGYPPLLDAIARHYRTDRDRVATACGASGANFLACLALLESGDDVLVERPAYDPLLAVPRALGANLVRFDRRYEDGYRLDLEAVRAAWTPRTRLVILANPNNPTGAVATPAEVTALGRLAADSGAWVLVDEVYLETVYACETAPAATLSDRCISTSSLTKAYGLNALRCGWIVAAPDVIERVRRARDLVDAIGAIPTERLAALAFEHLDRLRARARSIVETNAANVARFVESRPELEWVPPAGGTVAFPRIRGIEDARAFASFLLDRFDTAVVPGRFFEGPAHFRIAGAGDPEMVARGLEAVREALDRPEWRG
jgi:hypothetical protein